MPKKKTKTGPNLFDFLNQIYLKTQKYPYDKKSASAYMLSLWLSHDKYLINIVDKSIKKNKLNKNVSILEKNGADKVVIQFNKIAFDDLIKLMGYITRRYGILIENIDIQRDDNGKLVNSRVILKNKD